ncbi:MAG: hypothetical protein GF398_04975 [Chitinivibrionales bacterium]|nr:hypothetical protein [Chitinivibrionales bacterium]
MNLTEYKCPMCSGRIFIDLSTGKIMDHKTAEQKKVGLEDFIKNQQNRSTELEEKAKRAREEAEKRKATIEEKFKKAKANPDELEDKYENPFKWD